MVISDSAREMLEFFDYFWGGETGRIYLASMQEGDAKAFKPVMSPWPEGRTRVVEYVQALNAQGHDVWFSPAMYKAEARSAARDNIASVNTRWAEIDHDAPSDWAEASKKFNIPEPTLVVQSSVEGRQHVYWRTERTSDIDEVQDTNRALSSILSADKSGWDANQLLRIPGTSNYGWAKRGERKPWFSGEPPLVQVKHLDETIAVVPANAFSALQRAEREVLERLSIGKVPSITDVLAQGTWSAELLAQFKLSEKEAGESSRDGRSGALMHLSYLAAESGLADDQMYTVLQHTAKRWNKYEDRSAAGRDKLLRDLIARARAKVGYVATRDLTFAGLLGEKPAERLEQKWERVYSYGEFRAEKFEVNWLLDGLIRTGGFGLITGQPNVGKTTASLIMGMDLATDQKEILSYKNTSGAKKIMFLSLEMGPPEVNHFFESLEDKYKEHLRELDKNFFLFPIGSPMYFTTGPAQLALDNMLSQYRPDLLIIDSLRMTTDKPLSDEIASKELMTFFRKVRMKYSCAILAVHHERKRSGDKSQVSGELSDMYGSQNINAEVEWAIAMREQGLYVALDTYKNRLAPKKPTMLFERGDNMQLIQLDHKEGMNGHQDQSKPFGSRQDPTHLGGDGELRF